MKYVVIGLGNYGSVLASELTELGHEVIGVDSDPMKVEMIKDKIASSFVFDSTDDYSLCYLPLKSVDVVIVAIGEAFGASIKTVALLKKMGVKHIYARAMDSIHSSVLEAFDIDRILTPEQYAARMLVQQLDLNVNVESMRLDKEYYIVKFRAPASLVGYALEDLALEQEFKLKIVSLIESGKGVNNLGATVTQRSLVEEIDYSRLLCESDILVCQGKYRDFMAFWRSI